MQLSQEAREALSRQRDGLTAESPNQTPKRHGNGTIWRYATPRDKAVVAVSAITAIVAGALNPLLTIVYGNLINAFSSFGAGTSDGASLRTTVAEFTLYYVYCAIGIFVFIYVSTVGFYYSGERIANALRRAYLKAVISQNMAFFDGLGAGEVTSRIMSDMGTIQQTITSKISVATTALASFASAFIIMYIVQWRTALVLSPTFLIMLVTMKLGGSYSIKHHKQSMAEQNQAASLAEESISSIRQVKAFGIRDLLIQKYTSSLSTAGQSDLKARYAVAGMIAWSNAMPCLVYALSFWAGSLFLVNGQTTVSAIATTTLAIIVSAFAIIRIAPSLQAVTSSIATASQALSTIARRSPQDPFSSEGTKLSTGGTGDITLRNVSLVYPSRENILVLDKVDIVCPSMKTTAIVGPSGSGKSSIVSLVQRFYEPTGGKIELDGHDIQGLNLAWLRSQISLVDQDPVLFNTTIFENIRYGLVNSLSGGSRELSEEEVAQRVVDAAKEANAHGFIMSLANGYHTRVGERGVQLSGGQRQRIAIARALVKKPTILLLDEATSALDAKSEGLVQGALDSASKGRTTIVIAHKLSTIRHADQIIVMDKGRVVETGVHAELVARGGVYAGLVQKQQLHRDQFDHSASNMDSGSESIPFEDLDLNGSIGHGDHKKETPVVEMSIEMNPDETDSGMTEKRSGSGLSIFATIKFILRINREERKLLVFGVIIAIVAGVGIPVQSILFAKLLDALSLPNEALRSEVNLYSGLYVLMAGVAFITWMLLGYLFARSTEALSRRAKTWTLQSILSQDVSFFDQDKNSSGSLSTLLSSSTEHLSSLGGPVIGSILTFISTIAVGIFISLAVGWKLALVCTATIPIIVGCGWLRLQMLAIFDAKVARSGTDAAAYASEVVGSVKTIASLGLEEFAIKQYETILSQHAAKSLPSILSASALYAGSQSLTFLCAALGFWYGGQLVSTGEYTNYQFYICFVALVSGAQTAGSIFSFAPDASKAMSASRDLDDLFNTKPSIDRPSSSSSSNPTPNTEKQSPSFNQLEQLEGTISLRNITFAYPNRPNHPVLKNFTLTIQKGQHIALVGPSGCGKSTVLSLIERFYDPDAGIIEIDGKPLTSFPDPNKYRQMISLVSQEATLYAGTIRENIAMGRTSGQHSSGSSSSSVSDEEIERVCRLANIHDFILSLPDGLSTTIGPRGTLLSGGQRQRIAIACALLRNPKILLLDEATAALDAESEAAVQEALDHVMTGNMNSSMTVVSIAHRLSSIRNADLICFVDCGRIVESGRHGDLMEMRGRYWELARLQSV